MIAESYGGYLVLGITIGIVLASLTWLAKKYIPLVRKTIKKHKQWKEHLDIQ